MTYKGGLVLALVLCAVVLAYSVGTRLSDEAVNVIVGVSCGVAASVPVSLGLLVALTRRRREREDEEEMESGSEAVRPQAGHVPHPTYPQVIVVAPPQNQLPSSPYANLLPPGYSMNEPPRSRDFKIIGDDDDE